MAPCCSMTYTRFGAVACVREQHGPLERERGEHALEIQFVGSAAFGECATVRHGEAAREARRQPPGALGRDEAYAWEASLPCAEMVQA